jgi:hypothetical protein
MHAQPKRATERRASSRAIKQTNYREPRFALANDCIGDAVRRARSDAASASGGFSYEGARERLFDSGALFAPTMQGVCLAAAK